MSSVGIYMPAFNVEKYIDEAVESIKKQTFQNWELVIIDDCSTDKTYEVAKKHMRNNIRVYQSTNHYGKIGALKNECIAQLSPAHDYICHVGSDDLIPPDCLKIFVDYMDKHPEIGACCGNFKCFNDEGHEWAFPHVANSGDFDSNILLRYMCLFPMRFYRKSVVEQAGKYSDTLSSAVDYDLALRLVFEHRIKIHRIKEPINYYYRQHSQQVSTRARKEQDLNAKHALESSLKRRGCSEYVSNDAPPFILKTAGGGPTIKQAQKDHTERNKALDIENKKAQEHFIWGKK